MEKEPEHGLAAQWYDDTYVWTECHCGARWKQGKKTDQDTLDDLLARHVRHFNDKTTVL